MKRLYEVYINENKRSYLVSNKRLEMFREEYKDIEIIRDIGEYTFEKIDEFFKGERVVDQMAYIVTTEDTTYTCRKFYNRPLEDGFIWDRRTKNFDIMLNKLRKMADDLGQDEKLLMFKIKFHSGFELEKIGERGLQKVIDYYSDYKNNERKLYEMMSGIN